MGLVGAAEACPEPGRRVIGLGSAQRRPGEVIFAYTHAIPVILVRPGFDHVHAVTIPVHLRHAGDAVPPSTLFRECFAIGVVGLLEGDAVLDAAGHALSWACLLPERVSEGVAIGVVEVGVGAGGACHRGHGVGWAGIVHAGIARLRCPTLHPGRRIRLPFLCSRIGHLFFGEDGTFLLWVDMVSMRGCNLRQSPL